MEVDGNLRTESSWLNKNHNSTKLSNLLPLYKFRKIARQMYTIWCDPCAQEAQLHIVKVAVVSFDPINR